MSKSRREEMLNEKIHIKLERIEDPRYNFLLEKLSEFQVDADEVSISINELKEIIPKTINKGILGSIILNKDHYPRFIGFYDGTVFVSDIIVHTDTLISISLAGDFHPTWWHKHEIPVTPEIQLDGILHAAYKYYKTQLNRIL